GVTSWAINGQNISNLTGIEDFTSLTMLFCYSNQLTSIDVSALTSLVNLNFGFNQISSVDLSSNSALTNFICNDNLLSSLDLSSLSGLVQLNCTGNQLTSLDVRNGNNTNFIEFQSSNNPNLNCISADDATWATTNWTNIDSHTSFSDDCNSIPKTYVPDDNFEAYLETHTAAGAVVSVGDANSMGDGIANNNLVTTANISGVIRINL
ncbi:MAG: leucine-rich repeat domain-containing protein, partial [Methylophagaceae bacterium]